MTHFFVFEGPDFTGKSSCASYCKEELEKKFPGKVHLFRAPGGSSLGERLRDIARIDATTVLEQTTVYLAALMASFEELKKIQDKDAIVLLDRWTDSLMVYQVKVGVPPAMEEGFRLITSQMKFPKMLRFMFRISPKELEQRVVASEKTDTVDRFETAGPEYRRMIVENYLDLDLEEHRTFFLDTDKCDLAFCQNVTLETILREVKPNENSLP